MNEKAGLYFHIPFCRNKCPYCDFYSVKYEPGASARYASQLAAEMRRWRDTDGVFAFDTVYFGGGTPSIVDPLQITGYLHLAREYFHVAKNSEITVECNPSKDLHIDLACYAKSGVNRISIGMQSAVDKERFALGRRAGSEDVARTVSFARSAGIENISLDVMLGTPGQTLASLEETFDFIDRMKVQHISAYMLKLEPGTKFYEMQGRLALPDEDEVAEMYLKTVRTLEQLGLKQYEISNFARPGYESRHNLKYWRLVPYLGIGKSAHSFWGGKRFYYDTDFRLVPDGDGGSDEERIMLGLRLTEGIEKSLVQKPYAQFIKMGLLRETDSRIALTPEGMLVSNTVINELI